MGARARTFARALRPRMRSTHAASATRWQDVSLLLLNGAILYGSGQAL